MKAIRVHAFGGPEVLRLEEISVPVAGPGQVVVRIRAVGINPVETYIRSGNYGALPQLPYTPGKDAAGTIESAGEGVEWKPGERVYITNTSTGSYAEFALCNAEDVYSLLENVSFEQGAAVNTPYSTAFRALFQRAKALPGETVLIHGATGGVGLAAVQLAASAGLVVIGSGGTEAGRKLVLGNGASHVLDHHDPEYFKQLKAITNGRGVDVIVEMLANINLAKDLSALAFGGRVVVVGNRGQIEINPRDLMSRDAAVLGMVLFNATREEIRSIHAAIGAGLNNGTLKPVIGQRFSLAQAAEAHIAVLKSGAHGKIVLTV